jgi:hypothetical protein
VAIKYETLFSDFPSYVDSKPSSVIVQQSADVAADDHTFTAAQCLTAQHALLTAATLRVDCYSEFTDLTGPRDKTWGRHRLFDGSTMK